MKHFLPFFLVTFLIVAPARSQQNNPKIDSILRIIDETSIDSVKARNYLELSDLTMYNDQHKTLEYIEKARFLYKKSTDLKGIAKLYAQKANYYYRLGQIDSARTNLLNSVNTSLKIGDTLRAAVIRHNIAILDHYQGNSTSATEIMKINIPVFARYKDSLHLANAHLFEGKIAQYKGYYNIGLKETYKALKIHENLGDDFRIAEDMFQIGLIYQSMNEHKSAIAIFEESIVFYDKVQNEQSKAQVLNYLADSHTILKNYQDAEELVKKSLELSKKLKYNANIARAYENWGTLKFKQGDYDASIEYYQNSFNTWKSIGSQNNQANLFCFLGKSYAAKNNHPRALQYFNQSLNILKDVNYPDILNTVLLEKAKSEEFLGNYKEALASFKQNKILSDSIFTVEQATATQELKTIYETEKKEQQIALQEKEITVLEQKAEISTLQKILLGGLLVLSLIGFYGIRQKLKRNKLEKEKVDAELAFKKKELTTHALHLAKKNEVLEGLKQKAEELKASEESKKGYQQLIRTINFDLQDDNNWENFSRYFEEVHKDFNSNVKLKYPQITSNELRLLALLKMNLSSKEIANILNISPEGIKKARYRLRKKLDITTEDSLQDLVLSL
ncbi:tetratricopeptide repeat protein [Flagellimonas sp. 2504JD4-2]